MDVRGIGWAGVRTERFAEMRALLTRIVGDPRVDEDGFAVWRLPNGDAVELFGADDPEHRHFSTGPVVGFQVDDVDAARAELEAAGVEFLAPTGRAPDGGAWAHFRAPDGNVWEVTRLADDGREA